MAQPSPTPVRFPSGVSTDFPTGPLRQLGIPHPFRFQTWADDFNAYDASTFKPYIATVTNTGTIAQTAGAGGLLLMTTAALAADLCSIQLKLADFVVTSGKKAFFLVRLKTSSAANSKILAGLIQTTTTPFTVTDGLYFFKDTGSASNLVCNVDASSVSVSTTIPTAAYSLADATNIDLAFMMNRGGDVEMWVGSDLVSYQNQDAGVAVNVPAGPVARVAASAITLPTATLNLTVAIASGSATVKTATVDFVMAAVER